MEVEIYLYAFLFVVDMKILFTSPLFSISKQSSSQTIPNLEVNENSLFGAQILFRRSLFYVKRSLKLHYTNRLTSTFSDLFGNHCLYMSFYGQCDRNRHSLIDWSEIRIHLVHYSISCACYWQVLIAHHFFLLASSIHSLTFPFRCRQIDVITSESMTLSLYLLMY